MAYLFDNDEDPTLTRRWQESIHDYDPGPDRCCRAMLDDRACGSTESHSSVHEERPCCRCEHGVYLHTDWDIPCGRCEHDAS